MTKANSWQWEERRHRAGQRFWAMTVEDDRPQVEVRPLTSLSATEQSPRGLLPALNPMPCLWRLRTGHQSERISKWAQIKTVYSQWHRFSVSLRVKSGKMTWKQCSLGLQQLPPFVSESPTGHPAKGTARHGCLLLGRSRQVWLQSMTVRKWGVLSFLRLHLFCFWSYWFQRLLTQTVKTSMWLGTQKDVAWT